MGIELDVLVGHPEHELLFVATQVARSAGLKDPNASASAFIKQSQRFATGRGVRAGELLDLNVEDSLTLTEAQIRAVLPYPKWRATWLLLEADVYQMLLRSHSPTSEPFRKWVTEEVLPTIRKTGKYNAEESTNPMALRT